MANTLTSSPSDPLYTNSIPSAVLRFTSSAARAATRPTAPSAACRRGAVYRVFSIAELNLIIFGGLDELSIIRL